MTRRYGKLESYKIKQIVFLAVLGLLGIIVYLAFSNQETVVPLVGMAGLLVLIIFLVKQYDFLVTLKEYERVVVYRFGRVVRVGGPGWTIIIPLIESFKLVDLRTQTIDIPPQDVITNDKVVVKIDAVLYLFVRSDKQSVINSVIEVEDYKKAANSFVIATIRDVAGGLSLGELISNIGELNKRVQKELEKIAESWGVTVEAVQISQIIIPKELELAFTRQKAAEQERLIRTELAMAHQVEIEAVRKAAEQLSDKAIAYYYIRALEKLGEGKATKIIFPMELSKLASQIGSRLDKGADASELEPLFKKYLPAVQAIVAENEKKKKAADSDSNS